jgi:hypothetical protein
MTATIIPGGFRGFDCNVPLTALTARRFYEHGYTFVLRYVPRIAQRAGDLTAEEISIIRAAGLGLMPVQHVEPNEWTPTPSKGGSYGRAAAVRCLELGIAPETSVWLDLESVAAGVPTAEVIGYCNNWYKAVRDVGFSPGIYVGWQCGLSAHDLYWRLKFRAFWSAYNLDSDQHPVVRGVQMHQREPKPDDLPHGVGIAIDVNLVSGDALGGLPVMDTLSPRSPVSL